MNARATLSHKFRIRWPVIIIAVLVILLVGSTTWAYAEKNRANQLRQAADTTNKATTDGNTALDEHAITPLTAEQASNNSDTTKELAYLIEEEKLAHDVYQVMYDTWGSRVFNNIKNSETTHQSMVLAVMKSRGLSDPRTGSIGTFANQDLQKLYDTLIAQGKQSQVEAYKVGVLVEETDIADIKKTLDHLDAKDTDVKDVLENLQNGSENHLRAFNRQISR